MLPHSQAGVREIHEVIVRRKQQTLTSTLAGCRDARAALHTTR
jgi:hypothetical protein